MNVLHQKGKILQQKNRPDKAVNIINNVYKGALNLLRLINMLSIKKVFLLLHQSHNAKLKINISN